MDEPVQLIRYDAARRALAEAKDFDEVKQIRNVAMAAQIYAQQAQDKRLLNDAIDIRERAERMAGEKLREMEKNKGARAGGTKEAPRGRIVEPRDTTPKLADIGVTKTQSSRWQRKAAMPPEAFEDHLAAAKSHAVNSLDRVATQGEKRERRAATERNLAAATIAASEALGSEVFGVIYADPPWRFEPYSRDTGMDRAADNHYPTMTLDDIKALPVPAADDCVLFLWATAPMLPQAIEVMAAWGFAYRSHCVWLKDRLGTGYWFRNRHELLLIGTRGSVPAPAPGEQYASVIAAEVERHSAKPFHFREMIEEMFPTMPRAELFARDSFVGWESWGNEVNSRSAT